MKKLHIFLLIMISSFFIQSSYPVFQGFRTFASYITNFRSSFRNLALIGIITYPTIKNAHALPSHQADDLACPTKSANIEAAHLNSEQAKQYWQKKLAGTTVDLKSLYEKVMYGEISLTDEQFTSLVLALTSDIDSWLLEICSKSGNVRLYIATLRCFHRQQVKKSQDDILWNLYWYWPYKTTEILNALLSEDYITKDSLYRRCNYQFEGHYEVHYGKQISSTQYRKKRFKDFPAWSNKCREMERWHNQRAEEARQELQRRVNVENTELQRRVWEEPF